MVLKLLELYEETIMKSYTIMTFGVYFPKKGLKYDENM